MRINLQNYMQLSQIQCSTEGKSNSRKSTMCFEAKKPPKVRPPKVKHPKESEVVSVFWNRLVGPRVKNQQRGGKTE